MSFPHPIETIMRTTMEQLKQMVDVNTIVGDPLIAPDGTMIVPVSKVSTGFVSGGGEYAARGIVLKKKEADTEPQESRYPFAGASAAGISLTPMAFVVVGDGCVKVIPAQYGCTVDRIIEMVPRLAEEVKKMLSRCCRKGEEEQDSEARGTMQ